MKILTNIFTTLSLVSSKTYATITMILASLLLLFSLVVGVPMSYYYFLDQRIADFSNLIVTSEPIVGSQITYTIEVAKYKKYTGTSNRTLECYSEKGYTPITLASGNATSGTGQYRSNVKVNSIIPDIVKGQECKLVVIITYEKKLGAKQSYRIESQTFIIK